MRYGLYLPNYGEEAEPRAYADLTAEAEQAGWDGFFIWDHILASRTQRRLMVDPWVTLAAMAMTTERIRLGTTVTPVARRRPWKLARETVTLDRLSGGRLILGVGLGEPAEAEYECFGEDGDARIRAAKLDEGLQIMAGLWSGRPFSHEGIHYRVEKTAFVPKPVQSPRIPVWVGGFWPNKPPFRRAARWDGMIPLKRKGWLTPDDLSEILAFVHQHRTTENPFDAAVVGTRDSAGVGGKKGAAKVAAFTEAGGTWWLESLYQWRNSVEDLREQIRRGPPKPC